MRFPARSNPFVARRGVQAVFLWVALSALAGGCGDGGEANQPGPTPTAPAPVGPGALDIPAPKPPQAGEDGGRPTTSPPETGFAPGWQQ